MNHRPDRLLRRFAGIPAALAAVAMVASPAHALPLPGGLQQGSNAHAEPFDAEAIDAQNHRRGRYGTYRHRRGGSDLGDILTGVLVIGGIAAVANAATSASRDDGYRHRDARYPEQPYRSPARNEDSLREGSSIDRSVDLCIREVEREARVAAIDTVDRTSEGWRISGTLLDGAGFSCSVDGAGRVGQIDYGAGVETAFVLPTGDPYAVPYQDAYEGGNVDDRQHDAEVYRQARLRIDGSAPVAPVTDGPLPSYPGGPLPGEQYQTEYARGDEPFRN